MNSHQKATLSRKNYAKALDVGTSTIGKHLKLPLEEGGIKHFYVGNHIRILASEVEDWPKRMAELQAKNGTQ